MEGIFRVAIVQNKHIKSDCKTNTKSGLDYLEAAKSKGADIVLFPECFITGYHFPISNEDALADDSQYIQEFCDNAKKLKIGAVVTSFTKGEMKPRNSAFVVDKQGRILMKYSKVHTCDFADESMLEGGDEFSVCDFDGVKIGIMICYDREYPESARVLMLKGAELILVPNDCEGMKPRLQALSTRAYENMVGVAMANPAGEKAGNSCAFSPIVWDRLGNCVDNIIVMADELTEDILMAEFDMAKIREYRNNEMMGNTFRKVKAYGELQNSEIKEPFIRL